MKFISDLHIHSHYSRATSKNLTPEYLDYWAQLKGIDVVGTGDCIHPGWLAELKEKLLPLGNGLYRLKKEYRITGQRAYLPQKTKKDIYFILTGEISSIYKKNGKIRKVHNV
ncbi:MAG: DNA helicase UvrD, partial [Elusimicrobiota bacterium]